MDELKTLWRHADDLTLELDQVTRSSNIKSVYQQMQDEDRRLKKYLPWTYGLVALMLVVMMILFYVNGILTGPLSWLGMGLVLLASWCVAYFTQLVRVPYKDFAYAQPTLSFLYQVKDALRRKRFSMIAGVILQTVFITGGLTLMIFSDGDSFSPGAIGGFFGLMLGLGGTMAGLMILIFEANYGKVRKVVEEFLGAEDTLDLV